MKKEDKKIDDFSKNKSPHRKFYDIFILIFLGIIILGCIPFAFLPEELEGATLIYFLVWLSFSVINIIVWISLSPYIRKKEIEFFKWRYSYENLDQQLEQVEKTIEEIERNIKEFNDKAEHNNEDVTLGWEGDPFVPEGYCCDTEIIPYDELLFYAIYECRTFGEMYKVFIYINYNGEALAVHEFRPWIYYFIKKNNIHVSELDNVLTNCGKNIKEFLENIKLKKKKGN